MPTITAPKARKVNLIFHGPFVFKSTPKDGLLVLAPVVPYHLAVYGEEPLTDRASVKRRKDFPNGQISVRGIAGSTKRYVLNDKLTFRLPSQVNYVAKNAYAVFQLPYPVAGALGGQRKFEAFESYTVSWSGKPYTIGPKQVASRAHVLQYAGDPKSSTKLATLHFHVEFAAQPKNLDPLHDLRAIEHLYGGQIRINNDFPVIKKPIRRGSVLPGKQYAAGAASRLIGNANDLNSLYDIRGGLSDVHCENYGEKP